MNRPGEEWVWPELIDLLLEQQRIRAEVDKLLAGKNAFDDLVDLAVQERLATRNDDDRRATFIDSVEAFGDAQALIEDRIGVVDLTATGTGQVAAEQRLQHQHERVAFHAAQMRALNIGEEPN